MMKKLSLIFLLPLLLALSHAQELKPHHAKAGLTCISCHGTDDPLDPAEEKQCLVCHQSRDAVAKLTSELTPNPHFGHEDGLACNACHKEHEPSVLYCNQCHSYDYTTP